MNIPNDIYTVQNDIQSLRCVDFGRMVVGSVGKVVIMRYPMVNIAVGIQILN